MKKYRFLLIYVLLATFSTLSYSGNKITTPQRQPVVEIEKIDFIDLERDYFYSKDTTGYKIVDIELVWDKNERKLTPQITHYDAKKEFDEKDLIAYAAIKEIVPEKFEQLFNQKKYVLYNDAYKRIELSKFTQDHFIICQYEFDSQTRKWELANLEQLLEYCYIKMGDKYVIKLLNDEPQYIVPLEKGFIVSGIEQKESQLSELVPYKKAKKITSKQRLKLINDQDRRNLQDLLQYELKKDGDGYTMYNRFGVNVLPETKYDSIMCLNYLFVTKKNNTYAVYKSTLEPITIKNIRTLYIQNYTPIEGIAGNKRFEIKTNGIVTYTKHKGWQRREEYPMDPMHREWDIMPRTTWYTIEKKENFYYINNTDVHVKDHNHSNVYVWQPAIDSLYFRNNMTFWIRQASLSNLFNTDFISQKNGKYGVYTLSGKSSQYAPFSLEELLPPIFDEIEPFDDVDDIFNHDADRDRRMFLVKDGLMGLYPIQKNVRYHKLKVYSTFARFMLPSGKKGWLDTITGEEFLDE